MNDMYSPPLKGVTFEEHTADIWIVVEAKELEMLMQRATNGIYRLMSDVYRIKKEDRISMIFNQPNIEGLLVDFLSELLYLFDGEGLIILDPELHITGGSDSISLKISSNTYSYIIPPEYSGIEIKAITHHDIDISEIDSGYRARFLVDI